MAIFLWTLAGLLTFAVVAVAALVSLPIRFRVVAGTAPHPRVQLWVTPFGATWPALAVVDSDRPSDEKKARKAEKRAKQTERKKARGKRGKAIGWARQGPRLISELLRTIHVRWVRIDGEFGLPDPADTGRVFGYATPLIYGLAPAVRAQVSLRPVFGRATLSGHLDAAADLTPIALVPPLLRFGYRGWRASR